jgi:hypothetical protein
LISQPLDSILLLSAVTMWSLFTVAPYACILGLLLFVYFMAYPFVEYIRDPKGE